ncbi:hypothetical protein [Mesobacillus zeae]|uniref:hypothetical protein n=1 Tax=Mesobacillus zeae TaxID=1917180 RepID=UPI0015E714BB|nr:hypothetical protein [Mesobacillus zeae]
MKKWFWTTLLITLIPLWVVLYLIGMMGMASSYLWENVYHSVYRRAGSPLDKK